MFSKEAKMSSSSSSSGILFRHTRSLLALATLCVIKVGKKKFIKTMRVGRRSSSFLFLALALLGNKRTSCCRHCRHRRRPSQGGVAACLFELIKPKCDCSSLRLLVQGVDKVSDFSLLMMQQQQRHVFSSSHARVLYHNFTFSLKLKLRILTSYHFRLLWQHPSGLFSKFSFSTYFVWLWQQCQWPLFLSLLLYFFGVVVHDSFVNGRWFFTLLGRLFIVVDVVAAVC